MNQPTPPAEFRTAPCATCGLVYFGTSGLDAQTQHDTVEAHELAVPRVNGKWTAGVFVVVIDVRTGRAVTDVNEVARLLAIHHMMETYPFEIEADDLEHGGWLVTLDADDYMAATEEGGFDVYIDGHSIAIPMH